MYLCSGNLAFRTKHWQVPRINHLFLHSLNLRQQAADLADFAAHSRAGFTTFLDFSFAAHSKSCLPFLGQLAQSLICLKFQPQFVYLTLLSLYVVFPVQSSATQSTALVADLPRFQQVLIWLPQTSPHRQSFHAFQCDHTRIVMIWSPQFACQQTPYQQVHLMALFPQTGWETPLHTRMLPVCWASRPCLRLISQTTHQSLSMHVHSLVGLLGLVIAFMSI